MSGPEYKSFSRFFSELNCIECENGGYNTLIYCLCSNANIAQGAYGLVTRTFNRSELVMDSSGNYFVTIPVQRAHDIVSNFECYGASDIFLVTNDEVTTKKMTGDNGRVIPIIVPYQTIGIKIIFPSLPTMETITYTYIGYFLASKERRILANTAWQDYNMVYYGGMCRLIYFTPNP